MRYLVDANVLSEPTKKLPNAKVVEWLRHNEREIAVDPIILGELRFRDSLAAQLKEAYQPRAVVRRGRPEASTSRHPHLCAVVWSRRFGPAIRGGRCAGFKFEHIVQSWDTASKALSSAISVVVGGLAARAHDISQRPARRSGRLDVATARLVQADRPGAAVATV